MERKSTEGCGNRDLDSSGFDYKRFYLDVLAGYIYISWMLCEHLKVLQAFEDRKTKLRRKSIVGFQILEGVGRTSWQLKFCTSLFLSLLSGGSDSVWHCRSGAGQWQWDPQQDLQLGVTVHHDHHGRKHVQL